MEDSIFASKLNITTFRESCFRHPGGSNRTVVINLNAPDGGIFVNLGLNCLGWLVSYFMISWILPVVLEICYVAVNKTKHTCSAVLLKIYRCENDRDLSSVEVRYL